MESWIDGYFESLAKVDTEIGQSEALALRRLNFPEALYRYRSLERLAYRLEELRDGYAFLSNPADFNDPYDSAFSTSYEQMVKQITDELEKLRTKAGVEFEDVVNIHSQGLFESLEKLRTKGAQLQQSLDSQMADFRTLVRVSCFAAKPNSVLMWSHYANQHTGICVEFSGSSMLFNAKFFELLHPVRYTEKLFNLFEFWCSILPKIDLDRVRWPTPLYVFLTMAACHKSKGWEYEEEWRLVSLDPASGPKFSLDSCGIKPSRIILGARIDQPHQAAIKELAEKISVPVVKARLAKDWFEIEF